MAQTPIMAAGGIVIREGTRPLIAVVQRRKDNGWVLPKGKLKRKERARAAARREVVEETGHKVAVREFLGAITYTSSGRPKVVYFWKMRALSVQLYEPMREIRAVEWLPLRSAIEKLSRPLERAFLGNIGQRAVQSDKKPARKAARKIRSARRRRVPGKASRDQAIAAILPSLFRQVPLGFRSDSARGVVPSMPR
jgi:8-oxo-dGTP diphosphatase